MQTQKATTPRRTFTSAEISAIREYVRGHRNREFVAKGSSAVRSKPLATIAKELDMQPTAVRDAMVACGWSQAARDAQEARE